MSNHTFHTQHTPRQPTVDGDRRTWRRRRGERSQRWLNKMAVVVATFRARVAENRTDETGNVITDNLAWIVFGVVAIVAIGALIKTLGSDVINWVQNQLGIN